MVHVQKSVNFYAIILYSILIVIYIMHTVVFIQNIRIQEEDIIICSKIHQNASKNRHCFVI